MKESELREQGELGMNPETNKGAHVCICPACGKPHSRVEQALELQEWHVLQGHRVIMTNGDETMLPRRGCLTCNVWFEPARCR